MNNKGLFWFLLLLLIAWIIGGVFCLRSQFCGGNEKTVAPITETVKPTTYNPAFTAVDGDFTASNTDEYFRFPASDKKYSLLSPGLEESLTSVANYLKENKNRILNITGEYKENETNNSLAVDLGQGRANSVKEWFEANGVPGKQITLDSKVIGEEHFVEDMLHGGILLSFDELSEEGDARLERIISELVGKPLTVYFKSGDNNLDLNQDQRENLADIIYYLDRVEGSSIEIGGHTDNTGPSRQNKRLSEKRAKEVRDYVKEGGISLNQMTVKGYGSSIEIESNKFEAGRAKNRRVEII